MSDGSMRGWTQAPDGTWLPPGKAAQEPQVPDEAPVEVTEQELQPAPIETTEPARDEELAEDAADPEDTVGTAATVTDGSMRGWRQAEDGTWIPPEGDAYVALATVPLPVTKPRPAAPARPVAAKVPPTGEARWETGHLVGVGIVCLVIGGFLGAMLFGDDGGTNRAASTSTVATTSTTLSPDDPRFAPSPFSTSTVPLFGQNPTQNPTQNPNVNPNLGTGTTTTFPFGLSPSPNPTTGLPTAPPAAPLTSFVGEGTFRVGIDIQPGTYRSLGPSAPDVQCFWERQATFGDSNSALDRRQESGQAIVLIEPTDRGFSTSRCQRWDRIA